MSCTVSTYNCKHITNVFKMSFFLKHLATYGHTGLSVSSAHVYDWWLFVKGEHFTKCRAEGR